MPTDDDSYISTDDRDSSSEDELSIRMVTSVVTGLTLAYAVPRERPDMVEGPFWQPFSAENGREIGKVCTRIRAKGYVATESAVIRSIKKGLPPFVSDSPSLLIAPY